MEKTWKNVFRITEEEDNYFDKTHSDHIDRYINIFSNITKPFPTANTNRLNADNNYTKEIALEDIKNFIRRTKKTPGSTKINKIILENSTNKTLAQLKNIFNACYSSGYFPNCFKEAIIKSSLKKTRLPQTLKITDPSHYSRCREKFTKE